MNKLKAFYNNKHVRNPFIWCLMMAFVYDLFIEILARPSLPVLGGLIYMVTKPLVFLDNLLIIYATLIISVLFKRRTFVLTLVSSVWIAIGITNGIILTQRMTPFTMKDLSSMADGMTIMKNYFSKSQILLLFGSISLLALFFLILFFKGPKIKEKIQYKKSLAIVMMIMLVTFGSTFGLIKVGVMNTFFGNLAYAYDDYGVPYCFINTWLNTGIHRPTNYSKKRIVGMFKKDQLSDKGTMELVKNNSANIEGKPNILFLQLESFVDPKKFTNMEYSRDPMPFYRHLLKTCSSGSLTVPACGAGTANTEFEVMTGLSVKFFGPGEYPFKSILKEEPAESIARDLGSIGYGSHAIHNHRAKFYNRDTVFANLGYDTFTSVEYMNDVEKTPKNWAKDKILTGQIMDALKSTKERDYIYTISVQGHGKYPIEPLLANPKVRVTKSPDEETKNRYEYYVNQVYEMDKFVKNLTETLSEFKEPVVLVMYGDHIPALDITEETYDARNLYQTQYVVWSNFPMEKRDKNQTAYQLAADVFDRLGIHTGTTIKYHQSREHKGLKYRKDLKMLGYDMLYGNDYIYGGKNPFKPTPMKLGVKDIEIDKVVEVAGKYYIKGKNFTEQSRITLDGRTLKTVYLGPNLLSLKSEVDPEDASNMKVSQVDKSKDTIISTTE